MEITHTVTVEDVIQNTDSFKKNLQNIILQRARTFRAKNDYRRKNHMAPLPDDPVLSLARIGADRLVTLYVEVRERRCSLSSPARRVLSECGDEAVKASMADFTRKILQDPAKKPAEAPATDKPERKPAARKKTAKTPEK